MTILFGFDSARRFFTMAAELATFWIDGFKFYLVFSTSSWIRLCKKDP